MATRRDSFTGFVPVVTGGIVSSQNLRKGVDDRWCLRSNVATLRLAICLEFGAGVRLYYMSQIAYTQGV